MGLPIISDSDLLAVQKPAQYLGGERGSIVKDKSEIDIHLCLAFPDTYEVGMSHTGYQILYDLINRDERYWAERAYTPLPDMEGLLRKKNAPLTSLESKTPLSEFDVVGFSLQYELCMSGILTMLELGDIPLLASERDDSLPLIIGGGPVAYHPEPFADFFDCFFVGDGEELVPEFLEKMIALKGSSREEKLLALKDIQGIYIPSFFEPQYSETGNFEGFIPKYDDYAEIERRVIATLENAPYPKNPIVPNIEAVHDRLSVEVMRGCVRGCRFCQAGYLYRPQRERPPEEIREIVKESLKNSGFEELSLLSLSTADYCSILPLLDVLKKNFAQKEKLAISFPSTRVDALTPELLQEVQPIRRSGFTMAPEGGTQRIRDVINKGVTDQQIIDTCRNVFTLGWSSVKLYFMIGLPTETDEDVAGIVDIAERVKKIAGRGKQITISVSTHVPKPHTPFQWAEQITEGETVKKQQFLYRELKRRKINFRYHSAKASFLEGVFARGDRQLGKVILKAYQLGTRLDGWMEELQFDDWMHAFEETGIDPHHYLHERNTDAPLPWDHISCDIPKRWFKKEWGRATESRTTPDCLTKTCSTCGACDYDGVRNVLFDRKRTEGRLNIIHPAWEPIIEAKNEGATNEEILHLLKEKRKEEKSDTPTIKEKGDTYSLKEYLKTEVNNRHQSLERTSYDPVQKLRLQYTKLKDIRFQAHLELSSILYRATRRADLPVVFSQGFNPRPKFSFGPPLQLGVESECEEMDMVLFESLNPEYVQEVLNKELPDGFQITKVTEVPLKVTPIQASRAPHRYRVRELESAKYTDTVPDNWTDLIVERTRKGKTSKVALKDFVTSLKILDGELEFEVTPCEKGKKLKPLEVVSSVANADPFHYVVKRIR